MNNHIIDNLRQGSIGIFPTDTAYGIGCRMDDVTAIKRVYLARNRPLEKALLVLVSSIDMAKEYVEITGDVQKKLIDPFWPGGLTIVLPCKTEKVPAIVRAEGNTLAVRMPNHRDLLEIIEKVGVPLVAPSANFSGDPTPTTLEAVDPLLISQVDFVMNGVCTMRGVSTIVDCTNIPYKLIREGVVKVLL